MTVPPTKRTGEGPERGHCGGWERARTPAGAGISGSERLCQFCASLCQKSVPEPVRAQSVTSAQAQMGHGFAALPRPRAVPARADS